MTIPRSEYPRPQFVRSDWISLNGEWDFEIDNSISGAEREFFKRDCLDGKITVPFCPESTLSGVANRDFMYCVWYRRDIKIPEEWKHKKVILHFGAVDYKASVYVNGILVGIHCGGYTPFSFDITGYLKIKENYITVCAEDNVKSGTQPAGKQSGKYSSAGCLYTRTTGIWQTVWMEAVAENYIKSIKIDTDISSPAVNIAIDAPISSEEYKVFATAYFDGRQVGSGETSLVGTSPFISIALCEKHLWDVGCGNLYDLKLQLLKDGTVIDEVESYFGLRSVALYDKAFWINGRKIFGRWVLDQGFYPDGIYTAPDDEALRADIEYGLKLGFNGARLHEKVFEPRFLYWADRLGYMVWGEHANWGLDHTDGKNIYNFLPEWMEAVERDYNHPSIIGWCPFNETWDKNGHKQSDEFVGLVYDVTKKLDPSRPVIDTSGNYHVKTDIFDIHDYEQDIEKFREILSELDEGIIKDQIYRRFSKGRQKYGGEPLFVSEYGGITWNMEADDGFWGYGNVPRDEQEFIKRYSELTEYLLKNKDVCAFCYTQLYDVEQERNGLMTYDRKFKFNPEIFYKINTIKAAIEE